MDQGALIGRDVGRVSDLVVAGPARAGLCESRLVIFTFDQAGNACVPSKEVAGQACMPVGALDAGDIWIAARVLGGAAVGGRVTPGLRARHRERRQCLHCMPSEIQYGLRPRGFARVVRVWISIVGP